MGRLELAVRPLKMDIKGVVGHVIQGTKVLLQCSVSAARPAANVTWYNGTELLDGGNGRLEMFETKVENNVSIKKHSDTAQREIGRLFFSSRPASL